MSGASNHSYSLSGVKALPEVHSIAIVIEAF